MKKIIVLLLCVFCQQIWSQNKVKKETIFSDSYLRLGTIKPNQIGNHSMSKDFESKFGFAASLYLIKYKKFRLGGGAEFSQYDVTDKSKIGEISYLNSSKYYFTICYDYVLSNKFILQPNIGYGSENLNLSAVNKRFTTQYGKEFRIGSYLDYRLNRSFAVFVSVNYISSSIEVNTNAEYKDYFGKAQQIQIGLGLKIY